ncbi:MAG: YkgJ family cysteine cluster protein [Deltaproteobacteria bacterium]
MMDKKFNKTEWDFFVTALKEEARTVLWDVGSNTEPQQLIDGVKEDLEALAPREAGQEDRSDEEIWTQIRERLLKAAYATRPYCIRCGTCCTTGSPTLLEEDIDLFVRDILKPEDVITLRKGEAAYSPATEELTLTDEEMIKIREKDDSKTCLFYAEGDRECTIYDSRPLQCRNQECWNPEKCEEVGRSVKLSRKALLEPTGSLWEVIQHHEDRCSYAEVSRAVARLGATKGATVQEILDLLRFDHHVREFIAEKFQLAPDSMDFFFGRPLRETIEIYGLTVVEEPDGSFLLRPISDEAGN